jgi:uncharacterized protein (TIGR00255 family)
MRSMTGFGRAVVDVVACEVRTLNHKGLDIKVRVPHGSVHSSWGAFEAKAIATVKSACERGRVDVIFEVAQSPSSSSVNVDDVRAFIESARALAKSLGVTGDVTASDVMRALAARKSEAAPSVDERALAAALATALTACTAARDAEGAVLERHVRERLDAIGVLKDKVRARTEAAPARLAEKLRARVDASGVVVDPARLVQEVALLAERVDVTEELERLGAHVSLGRALTSGRKLDFLCQELLREANTIGSKCQDADAAHLVVELKAEIERLREQVQNVE